MFRRSFSLRLHQAEFPNGTTQAAMKPHASKANFSDSKIVLGVALVPCLWIDPRPVEENVVPLEEILGQDTSLLA